MSTKFFSLLLVTSMTSGCAHFSSDWKYDTNKPKNIEDAATVSVSALPAVPFYSVRAKLKPNDPAKSANDYRLLAVEKALTVLESNRSSSALGFEANLLGISKSKTDTSTRNIDSDGNITETQDIGSSRTLSSGERPNLSVTTPDLAGLSLLQSGFSPNLDLELAMEAADYLYQRSKYNDAMFEVDLLRDDFQLWILRLNVDVQPNVRDMPYDVRSLITIGNVFDEVQLIPLFATNNYETSNVTNLVSSLSQLNASLSGVTGGAGLGAGYERKIEQLLESIGTDINTKISVAVHGENQLSVSLPAAYSPKSEYELRDQNYKITMLAYVKNKCADDTLDVAATWKMYNAQNGKLVAPVNGKPAPAPKIYLSHPDDDLPKQQNVEYVDDGKTQTSLTAYGVTAAPVAKLDANIFQVKSARSKPNFAHADLACGELTNFKSPYTKMRKKAQIDQLYQPKSYKFDDDKFSAKFPSISATATASTKPWYLGLVRQNTCTGHTEFRCYPMVKNKAASGKVAVAKPKYKSGLVSSTVFQSSGAGDKPKQAEIIVYVSTAKGQTAPSPNYLVKIKNAVIPGGKSPNGTPHIEMLNGTLLPHKQPQLADNSFVVSLDSTVEVTLRDVINSKVQVEIIPWDVAAGKAVKSAESQPHTVEVK